MKKLTGILLAGVMAFGFTGFAVAQQGAAPSAQPPQQSQQLSENISDAELQKFVGVQGTLEEIRHEYTQRLEATNDQDAANQLQQEAGQLMVKAVEDEGLDVEVYNQIAMALQTDEKLRERVESMMN